VDSMPAALVYPLARVGVAAVGVTGPPGVRERLLLAAAGTLSEAEAVWLGQELDALAGLLARGGSQPPSAVIATVAPVAAVNSDTTAAAASTVSRSTSGSARIAITPATISLARSSS
jgi:hypothetical protein